MSDCVTHVFVLGVFHSFVFVSSQDLGLDQFIVKRFDGKVRTAFCMCYRKKDGSFNYFLIFYKKCIKFLINFSLKNVFGTV